jgi:hypothetical protein
VVEIAPTMVDYFLNSMPEFTISGDSWIRLLVIKELMSTAGAKTAIRSISKRD